MILNGYTVIMLFIALLTGVLALILLVLSLGVYRRWRVGLPEAQRSEMENRSYLLLVMAAVVLSVKLLSWPFLYVTLQSYIPYIRGAMCIFGVTQAQPSLSGVIQVLRPVVFFVIGGWFLLNRLDRGTETAPLFKRKFLFLSMVSLLAASDSAAEFLYLTGFDVETDVGCCTTFFDLPERATAVLSGAVLGEDYARYMLPLYYLSNISLVAFSGAYLGLSHRGALEKASRNLVLLSAGVLLALTNSVITTFSLFEAVAPAVMELPHHRCIYCMWQYAPDSILMTALFVVGTFSPGWALLICLAGKHRETQHALRRYVGNLYVVGIIGIGASLAMATVHLVA